VLGCIALVLMGVVGCTSITGGTATPDTKVAPAYRSSVSASVSASSATSSVRESQRQQTLTKQAVVNACNSFATSANDAVDKMNAYTQTLNRGGNTGPLEAPARDALNQSATGVGDNMSDRLPQQLRDALNAYADAARGVARIIGPSPRTSEFNAAINRLNDRMSEAKQVCRASV
jgi:hypothetical protein